MRVCGFSFIRNAVKFDYPVKEAITSILPLCDGFVIALGQSEDETEALIRSVGSDKIRIIPTVWDEKLRTGGRVLADETNKAFMEIEDDYDWAFYIQGDECVHEKYLPAIRDAMEKWLDVPEVEGLLFNYLHFYGSYDYVGDSRKWYRREIRIIRNNKSIRSYKDAQGFRKDGAMLRVKPVEAYVYHYGWVKPPEIQQAKQQEFNKLWHDESWIGKNIPDADKFDYSAIDSLAHFEGAHPAVMKNRIESKNWKFSFDPTCKKLSLKTRISNLIENKTGWRPGEYKNYKIV
ncbi:MAG: hypothetical protein JXA03_13525 [Bacteroidales bacterium]|nr:hypothetical protein [Bacteroidales bacterium]